MKAEGGINFIGIFVFVLGLLFFYLGSKGYAWGWFVGTLLVFSVIAWNQITDISDYFKLLKSEDIESKTLKPYCYLGILQTILTISVLLVIAGLVFYAFIYGKDLVAILSEILKQNSIGYVLAFIGGWGLLTTTHHIWGSVLAKDFSFLGFLYNAKMVFFALGSIFLLGLGILFLFAT